jgi:SAM-dependent methyltransferase
VPRSLAAGVRSNLGVTCPICGAQSRFSASHPDAQLYRCPSCTHFFSDTASMKAVEGYDPSYFDERHQRWFEHPNSWLFDKIADAIPKDPSFRSVLDAGCGRGDFLRHLRKRRPDLALTGIDVSPNEDVDGISFIQGDFQTYPLHGPYDVVVSLAVIEHLSDVKVFARRVAQLTRASGLTVISTVNDSSLLFRLARGLHAVGVSVAFDRLYSRHHLNHFTPRSLEVLLKSYGMSPGEWIFHNAPFAAIDVPASSAITDAALRAAMFGICVAGDLTGTSYLQTVICRRDAGVESALAESAER